MEQCGCAGGGSGARCLSVLATGRHDPPTMTHFGGGGGGGGVSFDLPESEEPGGGGGAEEFG